MVGRLQLVLDKITSRDILNVSMEEMSLESGRIVLRASGIAVKVLQDDDIISAEELLKDSTLLDRGVVPMQVDDKLIEVPLERLHEMFGTMKNRLRKRVEREPSADYNRVLRGILSKRLEFALRVESEFNPEVKEHFLSDSFAADFIKAKADKRRLRGIIKGEEGIVRASKVSFVAKFVMARMISQRINRAVYFPIGGGLILNLAPFLNGSYENIEPVVECVSPYVKRGEVVSGADKVMHLAWKVFSGEDMCSLHYVNKVPPCGLRDWFFLERDSHEVIDRIVEGLESILKEIDYLEIAGWHRLRRIKWELDTLWELRDEKYITPTHFIFHSKILSDEDLFRSIKNRIKELRGDMKKMIAEVKGGSKEIEERQISGIVEGFKGMERRYTEIGSEIFEINKGVENIRLIQPLLGSEFREVIEDMKYIIHTRRGYLKLYKWVLKAAIGMKVLHDRGIIHRDIKPENIIGRRLGDLGLSCKEDEKQAKRRYCGTPMYSSPLVAALAAVVAVTNQHASRVGKKDDIYSFGVLVHEAFNRGKLTPPIEEIEKRANHIFDNNRNKLAYILRTLGRGLSHEYGLKRKITYKVEEAKGVYLPLKKDVEFMGYKEYNNMWRKPSNEKSSEYLSWMCTRLDPTRRPDIDWIISFAKERIAELKEKLEKKFLPIVKDAEKRKPVLIQEGVKSSAVHLPSLPNRFSVVP
jgi:serine/threonine protein kinase